MTYALGLDLGTTYTGAALVRDGRAEIVPLGNRAAVVPSMVHLGADGESVAGETAHRRATTDSPRVAREFKRRFGDPTPLLLGGTPIAPEALTARLARAVVDQVIEREGAEPSAITVTHPATWGPFKQDLLRQAMRMAGLDAVTLLSEPEAAAWEYASTKSLAAGATIAVYDLGGGTFDATVLRAGDDGFALLGEPEGIERLGGIDIDQAVFAFVVAALDGAVEALDAEDPVVLAALARLRADCVEAKEALSAENEAAVPVVLPGIHTEVRITRPELEALVRPVLGDTVAALDRAIRSAGLTAADLDAVLLVGGSSRIPLVGEMVGDLLGRPVAIDAHPKHLVALGAARHAAAGGVLHAGESAAAVATLPPEPAPAAPIAPTPAPPVVEAPVAEATPEPTASIPTSPPPVDPPAAPPVAVRPAPAPTPSPAPSAPARKLPVAAIAAAVVAVVALVGGIFVLGGGGGDGGDDEQADGGAGTVVVDETPPDCSDVGPFVCIRSVERPGGGAALVEFTTAGFTPGVAGDQLVFFLADIVATDHGLDVVAAGAPLPWNSNDPFSGWTAQEMARQSAVCALVVSNGDIQLGTGNCRSLP